MTSWRAGIYIQRIVQTIGLSESVNNKRKKRVVSGRARPEPCSSCTQRQPEYEGKATAVKWREYQVDIRDVWLPSVAAMLVPFPECELRKRKGGKEGHVEGRRKVLSHFLCADNRGG